MTTAIAVCPGLPPPDPASLLVGWLHGLAEGGRKHYRYSLCAYAKFVGMPVSDAMRDLLAHPAGAMHAIASVNAWKSEMLAVGLAPGTTRTRLAVLKSLAQHAADCGLTCWNLAAVRLPPASPLRAGRAVTLEDYRRLLAVGLPRDRAALALMMALGPRRASVVSMRYPDDVRCESDSVWLRWRAKGGKIGSGLLVNEPAGSMRAWLAARGDAPGRLFGWSRAGSLSHRLVRLAFLAGVDPAAVSSHAFRRAAITAGSQIDEDAMQRIAQHESATTTRHYRMDGHRRAEILMRKLCDRISDTTT